MVRLRRYSIHIHPAHTDEPIIVRDGFSIGAFLFGGFWLLYQKAWLAGIVCVAISIACEWAMRSGAMEPTLLALVQLTISAYLGMEGRDLQRDALERRGYVETSLIYADGEDAAMLRFYEQQAAHA